MYETFSCLRYVRNLYRFMLPSLHPTKLFSEFSLRFHDNPMICMIGTDNNNNKNKMTEGKVRSGCSQELIYADDLVLIAEIMEELIEKFKKWKEGTDTKR